jgi:hypothetical protein
VNLAWRATLVTVAATSAVVVLVACAPAPTPSPPVPSGSPTPSATVTVSASPSPSPTPSAEPGPALTKSQFAALISTGKLGTVGANLKPVSIDEEGDPDSEGAEGEEQSEAKSCVKMYQAAGKTLLEQAADDDMGAVMQRYSTIAAAAELYRLNRACLAEQARYSPENGVSVVADGTVGSALWWTSKDPDLNYQVTVVYGNVMAYSLVSADTDEGALVRAFIAQVDEAGRG